MNIVLGCSAWQRGLNLGHLDGIGVYSRELATALLAKQVHIEGVVFGRQQPLLRDAQENQSENAAPQIPFPSFTSGRRVSIEALLALLAGKDFVLPRELTRPFDLIHAPDHIIPKQKKIPVVATVMDLIPLLHPEWVGGRLLAAKNWVFARSIQSADHIVTISEFSKQSLMAHLHIPEERITVTPLGVTHVADCRSDFSAENFVAGLGLAPGFFLVLGTLQPRKNLERIIAAHQRLPREARKEHPLIVVGRNGWGMDHLLPSLDALAQKGEGKWLRFLPDEGVKALLATAQALVFPSLYEGFGLPVIEAFAAGCPVITSNTTSLPEVAGDCAWLVNPGDEEDIAAAMIAAIANPVQRRQFIDKGRLRAKAFTWEACADKTLEAYAKVL
ncbi:MAG: glycosyltransferase family 4 protein [Porticoccaceae bacterium]